MPGCPPLSWTQQPKAASLLAACAAAPPATITLRYRWDDERKVFTKADPRVAQLRRLYRAAEPPIDTPAWSLWLGHDEQDALAAAVAASALHRHAA